jgi:hypothetical protein
MAGAVLLAFTTQLVSKKSLNMLGNQLCPALRFIGIMSKISFYFLVIKPLFYFDECLGRPALYRLFNEGEDWCHACHPALPQSW